MSFGISAPTNVTNLFGNWLHGLDQTLKSQIRVAFVLCYGQYGMYKMILSLTNRNVLIFYRLFPSLCTGPDVGITHRVPDITILGTDYQDGPAQGLNKLDQHKDSTNWTCMRYQLGLQGKKTPIQILLGLL
jgi:hypothetical protein